MSNTKKNLNGVLAALLLSTAMVNAQDCIVTTSGGTIHGHVKRVSDGKVIYRKLFHRCTISVNKVLYIQYENGTKSEINPITAAKHYKNYSAMAQSSNATQSTAAPKGNMLAMKSDSLSKSTGVSTIQNAPAQPFMPQTRVHYIERIGSSFRIDSTDIVSTGCINQLMEQSGNPQVLIQLKAAKVMRTFSTISNVASFPSSGGGAFASYSTIKSLMDQMKTGNVSFKYYLNAGLSFMATLSLPITSGILKHIKNKLYDRTLLTYSIGH